MMKSDIENYLINLIEDIKEDKIDMLAFTIQLTNSLYDQLINGELSLESYMYVTRYFNSFFEESEKVHLVYDYLLMYLQSKNRINKRGVMSLINSMDQITDNRDAMFDRIMDYYLPIIGFINDNNYKCPYSYENHITDKKYNKIIKKYKK